MEMYLSLLARGGRYAPPPTAGGGRAAIQRWMNSVALRLAKGRRNTHVRMPDVYVPYLLLLSCVAQQC